MSDPKSSAVAGTDWTQLLADPQLVGHLGKLLQIYREASPAQREQALIDAMREIKAGSAVSVSGAAGKKDDAGQSSRTVEPTKPVTTSAPNPPPFEPDLFTPSWAQDRRRFPRIRCFVAVELRTEGSTTPVWGNLSNTSVGGCYVETATPVPTGVKSEIGLWVANGKIWVKGLILNGIVTSSNPCFGVRIKFVDLEPTARETLREFLNFVESTTRGYQSQHGYLAQIKR
jgi:hypothetical protein